MYVEKSTKHTDMLLFINFANYGARISAEATVNGTKITIPQQTLSNSKVITGSGAGDNKRKFFDALPHDFKRAFLAAIWLLF